MMSSNVVVPQKTRHWNLHMALAADLQPFFPQLAGIIGHHSTFPDDSDGFDVSVHPCNTVPMARE